MTNYPTESIWAIATEHGWAYALRVLWMAIKEADWNGAMWAEHHEFCMDLPGAIYHADRVLKRRARDAELDALWLEQRLKEIAAEKKS